MLGLLWPTKRRSEPTLLGRLGRVLHWTLTAFAVPTLLLGLVELNQASRIVDGDAAAWLRQQGSQWVSYGLVALIAGRAARYVLSAE